MPVVNQAGLVGKVTRVLTNSARVMLVTDARYAVAVKVTSSDEVIDDVPTGTTPSGLEPDEVIAAGTTTTTTVPPSSFPTATYPNGLPVPATTLPGATAEPVFDENGRQLTPEEVAAIEAAIEAGPQTEGSEPPTSDPASELADAATGSSTTSTTTTTTTVPIIEKEYGLIEGRGGFRLPQIKFVADSPSLAELQAGDLVETAGGSTSLAPPGIPVGRVLNRADRPGSGGPLLDVELHADLDRLNFVRVVLYKPLSEVGQ
jgi:rod shape-determining protein MreC